MFTIQSRPGFTVIVMAKMPKKIRVEVDRKIARGQCLQCSDPAEKGKRKLCGRCFWKRYRTLGGLTKDQLKIKDERDVASGRIGESEQGKRPERQRSA
jgi:hypothetical protein